MKAAVLNQIKEYPTWSDIEVDHPQDWVSVSPLACALNRRDYWITQGMYPGIKLPAVLGSDLCGLYDGREVIVNPGFDWGNDERVQSDQFHILGLPTAGALSEVCYVPASHIHDKPSHLNNFEAAALPLAGVTAYRSLFTKGNLVKGQKVLITGIGGGVASMCMLFALAAGAEVFVTSGSAEKLEKAKDLGAHAGFNYRNDNFHQDVLDQTGGVDLIVDSAAGDSLASLIKCVNPGGRVVFYGGTTGKINGLNPQIIFWRQITIMGSTMGSPSDFQSMLSMVAQHKIVPIISELYSVDQISQAFDQLKNSHQFGKIVIKIQ